MIGSPIFSLFLMHLPFRHNCRPVCVQSFVNNVRHLLPTFVIEQPGFVLFSFARKKTLDPPIVVGDDRQRHKKELKAQRQLSGGARLTPIRAKADNCSCYTSFRTSSMPKWRNWQTH